MQLILFLRDPCHLCELAEEVLAGLDLSAHQITRVDIDGHDQFERDYGWRIPVLRLAHSGQEIDWPFDGFKVRELIENG